MYKSNNNYVVEQVLDTWVLTGLVDDVAQMQNMMMLNETSRFIIELLADGKGFTLEQLVEAVRSEYDVPDDVDLLDDVKGVAEKMLQQGYWRVELN